MIYITYHRYGEAVNDFNYMSFVNRVKEAIEQKKPNDLYFAVSTEIAIQAIRLEIVKGNINCEDIMFTYKDTKFKTNKYAAFDKVPDGFCKAHMDLIWQIIRTAVDKHKEDRK